MRIELIPALADNYIHVLRDESQNITIVVDPAISTPVEKFLASNNWPLTHIFITHHHGDHIGGVDALRKKFPDCHVYGYEHDQERLPALTNKLKEGSKIKVGTLEFTIWHLPGHTTGHIAYISQDPAIAFTGDVLFGMGCGRVFEGTYEDMFKSLNRFKQLAPNTKIFCTHEYTVNNGRFALSNFPESEAIEAHLANVIALRERGEFTVPLLLENELNTNPFLLAHNFQEFSRLRDARNKW
jgi:hydroxyacylglutathione hydrolase